MYLLTATLLNSWKYFIENEYATEEDFLKTLHREPFDTTEAMLKGREFEQWAYNNMAEFKNAELQVKRSKRDNQTVFYGILDALKKDTVIDVKYTGSYEVGKFRGSYQTSMYLFLADARKMQYFISTKEQPKGDEIFIETYYPHEVEDIRITRNTFYKWLHSVGLWNVYAYNWKSKY